MRGFILAAGFGTRLQPITNHVPKALVSVCGKPLIERSLDFLSRNHITTIGVNTHYLSDQIRSFQQTSAIPFELFHEKDKIRGTGGAFDFARKFLADDDGFFVCNVDIVYHMDMARLINQFAATDWLCGLVAVKAETRGTIYYDPESFRYEGVPADSSPPFGTLPADYIGAAFYRKEFLDFVSADDFSIIPVWKRAGSRAGVLLAGQCYWRDIGTPAALARVHFDALDGTIDLDCPPHLTKDRASKRCFFNRLPEIQKQGVGEYAWVETETVPTACSIKNSVIFRNTVLPHSGIVDHRIISPFGEVTFG